MVTSPGSRRRRRRRTSSALPSSKRVMPKRSSFTSNHSTVNRSAIHGRKMASTCPESEFSTRSTMSSGTIGGRFGAGVSARGPRLVSPMGPAARAPSRGFTAVYHRSERTEGGMKVGNPYHAGAGRRVAKAPTWACRSVGRSLPWHGRGPEFKSRHVHHRRSHYDSFKSMVAVLPKPTWRTELSRTGPDNH